MYIEFAKLRARRAQRAGVLTCLRAHVLACLENVLACSRARVLGVLACLVNILACSRAPVLGVLACLGHFLACWRALMLGVLACLRSFLACSRARMLGVLACLEMLWRARVLIKLFSVLAFTRD